MRTDPLRRRLDRLEAKTPDGWTRTRIQWWPVQPTDRGPVPTGEIIFQRLNPETRQIELHEGREGDPWPWPGHASQ